ncbi:MAG: hypothetical protein CMD03_03375 [Flavobacteriales bacterium]|nr:hypothetical protein [Flavobacteriales bacterium]
MRKIFSLFLLTLLFVYKSNSQCSPNTLYTSIGMPGVFPPAIQIPNLPIPLGVSEGILGDVYNDVLTLVVLEDTTMDIGFLLPSAAVNAMNLAGISTTMTLGINHVFFDVQGLPNGINYQCDMSNCQYPSSTNGCIQLSGIPTVSGTFSVPVSMTVNIQLPSMNIPGFGAIGGIDQDLPTFTVQTYELFISGSTSLYNNNVTFSIFPNPTTNIATLFLKKNADVIVYNTLGNEVLNLQNVKGEIFLNKNHIGSGLYFVNILSNNHSTKTKFIIK